MTYSIERRREFEQEPMAPVQQNKQHHRKVLLNSFQVNGHTLEFHPQTQRLELPCTA